MTKSDDLRSKKQRKETISGTVSIEIVECLDEFCEARGVYRSAVIERALSEFLKRENALTECLERKAKKK
jgi:predicted transcriptional regulator